MIRKIASNQYREHEAVLAEVYKLILGWPSKKKAASQTREGAKRQPHSGEKVIDRRDKYTIRG